MRPCVKKHAQPQHRICIYVHSKLWSACMSDPVIVTPFVHCMAACHGVNPRLNNLGMMAVVTGVPAPSTSWLSDLTGILQLSRHRSANMEGFFKQAAQQVGSCTAHLTRRTLRVLPRLLRLGGAVRVATALKYSLMLSACSLSKGLAAVVPAKGVQIMSHSDHDLIWVTSFI